MKAAEKSLNQAIAPPLLAISSSTCKIWARFEFAIAYFQELPCHGQAHWPDLQFRLQILEAAEILPRMRCAIRLPWRVPETPLHQNSRRQGRLKLPLLFLQKILPSCGLLHEADDRIHAGPAGSGEHHRHGF